MKTSSNLVEALTYDDIQLVPQYSEVMSRSDVSLESKLSKNYKLKIPFVASPMDTVCGYEMAAKMMKLGGVGIVHRFMSVKEQSFVVTRLNLLKEDPDVETIWGSSGQIPIAAAIGVGEDEFARANSLLHSGANVLLIDVAHGDHKNVKNMIEVLKSYREDCGIEFDIIAGNVATYYGAVHLLQWGVDGLRVGIGGGCFTPEMEVKTEKGTIPIKDIKIGDKVYTHTGELKPVINKFEYEDYDEIYDIDGIEATENHKFYVVHESKADLVDDNNIHEYAEWVEAKNLSDEYFLIEL